MKDLGKEFCLKRKFSLGKVAIEQLTFESTGDEVLMFCRVDFCGSNYRAVLCATYNQFNELLLNNGDSELRTEISAMMGDALSMTDPIKVQSIFQIKLLKVFDRMMQVEGCVYHTQLFELPLEEQTATPDGHYVFVIDSFTFQKQLK